ncbi:acyl-coenzyme A:6-aminopenicillanic acid acyl-transferase-domain-containing protein [Xylariomycetidae sp. FL2044]|nr:acyl-coenzyme A:6-aminopenicillanic acid acyl-transferase-domain-containing protein [Xylariomycetidae sp. FL2044]
MRGIAEGAGVSFLDILALNVRTEIAFGLWSDNKKVNDDDDGVPSDGCTSLAWLTDTHSFLCQNWDWMVEQAPNLIVCHISSSSSSSSSTSQPPPPPPPAEETNLPDISMVTEAGIIGKIGLNSLGVGCCLNAIRCRGVDRAKLPIHLALRAVLESASRADAVRTLRAAGVAGSGHILVGDATGATGLECTSRWVRELGMDAGNRICHTNHLLLKKKEDQSNDVDVDVDEPPWLDDSPRRLERIRELAGDMAVTGPIGSDALLAALADAEGYPCGINRKQQEGRSNAETLFSIVMDLTARTARVAVGRPTECSEVVTLAF